MTGSIFSQLPNNLIMNIIKIAEDERKKEEQIQNTKNNLKSVHEQFDLIFKKIDRFYLPHCDEIFGEYESYQQMSNDERYGMITEDESREGEMYEYTFYEYIFMCNVFDAIEDTNEWYEWEIEEEEMRRQEEEDMEGFIESWGEYHYGSVEAYRERMAEYEYNNPPEDAYDWGEEPSWACD